jgi:uncharacterized membrane protein YciS (DUF1049 family)
LRITGYFWSFTSGFTVATLLWVFGPVHRVARKNPQLTIFHYASWLMASDESKFCLTATLSVLVLMVTSVICRYVWSRIRVRHDLVVKQLREKTSFRVAELEALRDNLRQRQQALGDQELEIMQKTNRQSAAIIAQAREEAQGVLDSARQEAVTITQARAQGAGNDRPEDNICVQNKRCSPFASQEPEPSDRDMNNQEQNGSSRIIEIAGPLILQYGLSGRQANALGHIIQHGEISIQDFERLHPQVTRRTLQRDLKEMVNMGLLISEGATHHVTYRRKT